MPFKDTLQRKNKQHRKTSEGDYKLSVILNRCVFNTSNYYKFNTGSNRCCSGSTLESVAMTWKKNPTNTEIQEILLG